MMHASNSFSRETILSPDARAFLQALHREFEPRRQAILVARKSAVHSLDAILSRKLTPFEARGAEAQWKTASIPPALQKRHVEITGPAEAKMIINALKSGADIFMADLEDALSPTWSNIIDGHVALQQALRRTLSFQGEKGKTYALTSNERLAALIVRPRGWHLQEPRMTVEGNAMSGSLFDFGLYLFHGAAFGIETGCGPFFYLPKLESPAEAKLWADVFAWSETRLGLRPKSIRATVLIETLPAALAMEEILFELRDYVVGLNAGRWDYLFSIIKTMAGTKHELGFPDRGRLTMDVPFMRRYAEKIVTVCTRRGAMPIGGMSALIPSRKDAEKNERALASVRADKEREVRQGFQGTWVAHPDLVPIARAAFENEALLATRLNARECQSAELIPHHAEEPFASSKPTVQGALLNIDVALRYIAHWLQGLGAVAIHGLMEDAATAEISRAQLWQWRKNGVILEDSTSSSTTRITPQWLKEAVRTASENILNESETNSLSIAESELKTAADILLELVLSDSITPFLTLPAMDRLKHQTRDDLTGLTPNTEGATYVHD